MSAFLLTEGRHWRIDPESGCWEWLKMRDARGYGRTTAGGAHRAVWRQFGHPLAAGVHLHHLCHNPGCVNPEHMVLLEPVAHLKHHRRGDSVLTEAQVVEIRERAAVAGTRYAELVKEYGVSWSAIRDIVLGYWWRDVAGPVGPVREHFCLECGTSLEGRHRAAKYCGGACRQRAFLRRKGGWSAYHGANSKAGSRRS